MALLDAPIEAEADGGDAGGIGKMFQDPNMWGKLQANPKTAPLLQDPQFVAQVCIVKPTPSCCTLMPHS